MGMSTAFSSRRGISAMHWMRHCGAMSIAVTAPDPLYVLAIAGTIHAVFQIASANHWHYPSPDCITLGGLSGNTNMSGAFLLPCALASLQIGAWIPAAVICIALYTTRCRAAKAGFVIGAIAGAVAGGPVIAWFLVLATACTLPLMHSNIDTRSINYRLKFWKELRRFVTVKIALVGMGVDCLRLKTGTMPNSNSGEAMRWTRAHNNVIQMFFDTGAIGALVFVAVSLYGIVAAYQSGQYAIMAGMVAMGVNGLAFHSFSQSASMVAFWLLLVGVAR
jgi:hypothetical protein